MDVAYPVAVANDAVDALGNDSAHSRRRENAQVEMPVALARPFEVASGDIAALAQVLYYVLCNSPVAQLMEDIADVHLMIPFFVRFGRGKIPRARV